MSTILKAALASPAALYHIREVCSTKNPRSWRQLLNTSQRPTSPLLALSANRTPPLLTPGANTTLPLLTPGANITLPLLTSGANTTPPLLSPGRKHQTRDYITGFESLCVYQHISRPHLAIQILI